MTKRSTGRGYFGSTEPQARKVLKQIEADRSKQKQRQKSRTTKQKDRT